MMEWVEAQTREETADGSFFFFYLLFSDICWTLLKCDTFHLSENLRLSDSQLPKTHRKLPRLVNVLAESNLVQT